jgi:hypothetical protein
MMGNVFAKNYTITTQIANLNDNEMITLSLQQGGEFKTIRTQTITNYQAIFTLDDNHPKGIYRINWKNSHLDVIFNHQDIGFITNNTKPILHSHFVGDTQNKNYYELLQSGKNHIKRDAIVFLLNYYPKNSNFYKELVRQNNLLANNYFDDIQTRILQENKAENSLLVRKIQAAIDYNALAKDFQNTALTPKQLFSGIKIDEFAIHSDIVSKRINLYFLQIYSKYKDDTEVLTTKMLQAKKELTQFFVGNTFNQQILQIIESIFTLF